MPTLNLTEKTSNPFDITFNKWQCLLFAAYSSYVAVAIKEFKWFAFLLITKASRRPLVLKNSVFQSGHCLLATPQESSQLNTLKPALSIALNTSKW